MARRPRTWTFTQNLATTFLAAFLVTFVLCGSRGEGLVSSAQLAGFSALFTAPYATLAGRACFGPRPSARELWITVALAATLAMTGLGVLPISFTGFWLVAAWVLVAAWRGWRRVEASVAAEASSQVQ